MGFKKKLQEGSFVLTSEVGPPKGIRLEKILSEIEPMKGRVDAINVTDQQSAIMRLGAFAASIKLKERGFDPVLQVTCRDRNRIALQSDLLSAAAFGIENVLSISGDHPSLGDHPETKPVYDLDAVGLLDVLSKLEKGHDANGHPLVGDAPRFFKGAAVNPGADPLEPEIIKMEKKIAAGAEFFQTQAIFDVGIFERFLREIRHLKTKILAGILILKSPRMAAYMNKHVPGVVVPEPLLREMAQADEKNKKGIEISIRLFHNLKNMADGVHFMPIGSHGAVVRILDAVGR